MRGLSVAHLFKLGNVVCLISSHLFESRDAFVGSAKLLTEHGVVFLDRVSHAAFALHFLLHSRNVVLVHGHLSQAL